MEGYCANDISNEENINCSEQELEESTSDSFSDEQSGDDDDDEDSIGAESMGTESSGGGCSGIRSCGADSYCPKISKGSIDKYLEDADGDLRPPSAADFVGKEFKTVDDAYKFYLVYARSVGFGVRKGDMGRNKGRIVTRRTFVCCKEGLRCKKWYVRDDRQRKPRAETRTNCKACLLLNLTNGGCTWKVRKLVEEHNHPLTPSKYVHLIRSHRRISTAQEAQIETMQRHGMKTSQIMGFMARHGRGFGDVGFSRKDLYNYIDKFRRGKIVDGDAATTLSYLEGRADSDGMTVARYTVIDNDRLGNLFWSDGLSRVNYQYFGDVLAFDATYKRNKYNKPLVIFSGCNHHKQTCVFGFALLVDERIETYHWLLEQFLEVMANRQPNVVVTDDDEAMKEAIRRVFPTATHRLCAWHLCKNAVSNIKNAEFCDVFKRCIYGDMTPAEFEDLWQSTVERLSFGENKWVNTVYGKKEMWATCYLRHKFCAGFRTTSRCEAINSFINKFIKCKYNMLELVQSLERVVKEYRNNELESQFKSVYTFPVYDTGMRSVEEHAASVYTRAIFLEVKEEILKASSVVGVSRESFSTTVKFQLCKFGSPKRLFEVLFDRLGGDNGPTIKCDCNLFSMNGIPCCHVFFVMKEEHVAELPGGLVLPRWRKDAKAFDDRHGKDDDDEHVKRRREILRYGSLLSASLWMSYLASKSAPHFKRTMDAVLFITSELEGRCAIAEKSSNDLSAKKIGDPFVVKSKGAPRKSRVNSTKRVCSNCSLPGHTKRTCTRATIDSVQGSVDTNPFSTSTWSTETGTEQRMTMEDEYCAGGQTQESTIKLHEQMPCSQTGISKQMFFGGQNVYQYLTPPVARTKQPSCGHRDGSKHCVDDSRREGVVGLETENFDQGSMPNQCSNK